MKILGICLTLAVGLAACKDEPGNYGENASPEAKSSSKVIKTEAVQVVKAPVEWGKKVACTSLMPDPAPWSKALGKEVTIADNSKSDAEAASVCQVKLAGTPPSAKEQEKMWVKNNRVLGTLPGDELCQVTAYCSFIYDKAEEKKKCEANGDTPSEEIGDFTCLRKIEAGADYRYIYTVVDSDSRCKLVINPGPSVIDDKTVKSCAKTAADVISPASLKVQ